MNHNSAPVCDDDISLASNAVIVLFIFLGFVLVIIQTILFFMFNGLCPIIGTIVFLVVLRIFSKKISVNVGANKLIILLNEATKKERAVFKGFHFKLPWEIIQHREDLEADIPCEIEESFPVIDGSVDAKASIICKIDSGEGKSERTRSKKSITYVRLHKDAIAKVVKIFTKSKMREYFLDKIAKVALKAKSKDILEEDIYSDLEVLLAIQVVSYEVTDLDPNKELQAARNAVNKAESLKEMVKALEDAGYSPEKARDNALLLDKDINIKKEIFDVNFVGLPKDLRDVNISGFGGGLGKNNATKKGGK